MNTPYTLKRFKSRFSVVLQVFLSAEGCGCLAEGRGRVTFWLWSIRFLRGYRDILAVSCGSLLLYRIAELFTLINSKRNNVQHWQLHKLSACRTSFALCNVFCEFRGVIIQRSVYLWKSRTKTENELKTQHFKWPKQELKFCGYRRQKRWRKSCG